MFINNKLLKIITYEYNHRNGINLNFNIRIHLCELNRNHFIKKGN